MVPVLIFKSFHLFPKVEHISISVSSVIDFQLFPNKGLFDRAIMQSGATSCPWALQRDVGEYTKTLAQLVSCPTSSSKEILKCLRQKTPEEIVLTRGKISLPVVSLIQIFKLISFHRNVCIPGAWFVSDCVWTAN